MSSVTLPRPLITVLVESSASHIYLRSHSQYWTHFAWLATSKRKKERRKESARGEQPSKQEYQRLEVSTGFIELACLILRITTVFTLDCRIQNSTCLESHHCRYEKRTQASSGCFECFQTQWPEALPTTFSDGLCV